MPESAPEANGRRDSLALNLPGGIVIQATGTIVILIVIALGYAGLILYTSSDSTKEHIELQKSIDLQREAIDVQSYLLTLPPEQRPEFNTPPGLWPRLRRSTGPAEAQ